MKKKLLVCLFICLLFSLVGCSVNVNEIALQSNYAVDNKNDYIIGEESGLGLKLIEYKDVETKNSYFAYVLAYLNDGELFVDNENAYVKSLVSGKTCISVTSTILDIGRNLNEDILIDLINRLSIQMNDDAAIKVTEKLSEGFYYIILKNEKYVFIDYLTTIPNISDKVLYNRFIIEDVSMLDIELTEEEKSILPDYLPELLKVLEIEEDIELPKK